MTATQTARRTEPYISLSKTESQRLFSIDGELTKIYLQLRWQANFKTGVVGATPERPSSIHQLEAYLGLAPDYISDVLCRLQKYGLIDCFSQTQAGQLIFRLPFSISGASPAITTSPAGQNLKLPAQREHESLLTAPNQYCSDDKKNPSITLSQPSTEVHGSITRASENRESMNDDFFDQMTQAYHDVQFRPHVPEKPFEYIPPYQEFDQDFDGGAGVSSVAIKVNFNSPDEIEKSDPPQGDEFGSSDAIRKLLTSLGFQHVNGSISQSIYPRLLRTYTFDEIKAQAETLATDRSILPTPLALANAMAKKGKGSGRKQGGVVL